MKARNIFMYILGALIVAAFFGSIGILIFVEVPDKNKDLLNISLGAEITAFIAVVTYFYGSSKGSADKNEIIANNNKQPSP